MIAERFSAALPGWADAGTKPKCARLPKNAELPLANGWHGRFHQVRFDLKNVEFKRNNT